MEEWPCYNLQDKDGNYPSLEERKELALGLNEFHDSFAIHLNAAQRYLHCGETILEHLTETKQIEKIYESGKKEKIKWEEIQSKTVNTSIILLILSAWSSKGNITEILDLIQILLLDGKSYTSIQKNLQ